MKYDKLRDHSIEDLVNGVQALASVASQSQVQSIAALGGRLTIEVSEGLNNLSGTLFTAKKQLVERMDALTTEIKSASMSMDNASREASKQTAAMVRWTRILVIVTGIYTLLTGGLLVATAMK